MTIAAHTDVVISAISSGYVPEGLYTIDSIW
jgi:hypothetical protein